MCCYFDIMCSLALSMPSTSTADASKDGPCSLEEVRHFQETDRIEHCAPIESSEHHIVLYQLPYDTKGTETPVPQQHQRIALLEKVDFGFASVYEDNTTCRWARVCHMLDDKILDSRQLEAVIRSYNPAIKHGDIQFKALHLLLGKQCEINERNTFFGTTLPKIVKLARRLPELFPVLLPRLMAGSNLAVSMSQEQAACLVANAFLCTLPDPNERMHGRTIRFSNPNFVALYGRGESAALQKLKCLLNYLRRVCDRMPNGVLTYERRSLDKRGKLVWWNASSPTFSRERGPLRVSVGGSIDGPSADGLLQMIFANPRVGGGVIGAGCVQEEIRFVINPELLVARILFEELQRNEAYFVYGTEQYSTFSNYAASFRYRGDYYDTRSRDSSGRRRCYIVGLDALQVRNDPDQQFCEVAIRRELRKAYVGFKSTLVDAGTPVPGIATGNWGCGAFGGDVQLKALVQLMMACITKRPLLYFTWDDAELRDDIVAMYNVLTARSVPVATLYDILVRYQTERNTNQDLFSFVRQQLAEV
ncbi:poly(ADP-ribose) glycohydrolase [Anopheles bellator]|uniref:poly(ADP-ribose) glycohydrolase n=1 Tax=Anopheles bellator TaxID=139047 RepID=UPI00264A17A8|nr:poly(ADP-ribose) glycohydrolase [Anopheles bellator]